MNTNSFKITELFMITQEEFNNSKTSEKIKLKCSICSSIYSKTKKDILQHFKRQKISNKFCSQSCKGIFFSKRQEISCSNCSKIRLKKISEITSGNNFCSSSCSASFNNKQRQHTESSKQKRSEKLKQYHIQRKNIYLLSPKLCQICSKELPYEKRNSKTCQKECTNNLISNTMKLKIEQGYNPQKHRGRKKSYLETSFKNWLQEFNIEYIEEYPVKIYENNSYKTCFFIDFYFPSLQIGIELDGTQHQKTIEKDLLRDGLIKKEGITIHRITHKEYCSKSKVEEVKKILQL